MFKKLLFITCLSFSLTHAEQITKILAETTAQNGTVESSFLRTGMSGIVIHRFDENRSTIVAKAVVDALKGNTALIKYEIFDDLAQDALPRLTRKPTLGDTVIFESFSDRVTVIAPNQNSYQKVTLADTTKTYIHPDHFAYYLSTQRHPQPTRDDLTNYCKTLSIGRLIFAFEKESVEVDCGTLKPLKTTALQQTDTNMTDPFYNRIEEIEKPFFSWFRSYKIGNFDPYYKKILGL